jgi:DNA-binding phage protein
VLPTARALRRDFINATIGFRALAQRLGVLDKSLMRMFGAHGYPHAATLFSVLQAVKDQCGLSLTVQASTKGRPASIRRAA